MDSGYQKFVLILEVNCISNLSPNHTIQLINLRTSVREALQLQPLLMLLIKAGDSLTDVQWLLYISKIMVVIACSLIQAGVTLYRCSVVTISARSWLLVHALWYKQV